MQGLFLYLMSRPEISLRKRSLFMDKLDTVKVKRTQKDYTLGFKLAVVDSIEKGDMTYKQAQAIYGIQGRSTVLVWLRKHGKLDWTHPLKSQTMPHKETPAQTIKRLERELADAKAHNLILSKVVEVFENDYGENARKKSSTASFGNSKQTNK